MNEPMWPGESQVHYNARTRPGYSPFCMSHAECGRTLPIVVYTGKVDADYHWKCPRCGKEYHSKYDASKQQMVY
jgi:hypothetical protein